MKTKTMLAIFVVFLFITSCTNTAPVPDEIPIPDEKPDVTDTPPKEEVKDTGSVTPVETVVEVPIPDEQDLSEQFSVTLTAEKVGDDVKLSWTAYPGKFTTYKVMRSTTDPNPKYPGADLLETISFANQTTYIDTKAEPAVNYYAIGVVADLNKGDMSNVVSIEFPDSREKEGNVISLSATVTPEGVNLQWDAYDEAGSKLTYYKVVRSETNPRPKYPNDSSITAIPYVDKTTYLDRGTDPGKTYYYAVTVVRKDLTRYSSEPVMVNT